MQRAFHSPKGLGCWNSYPVAALPQRNNSEQSGGFLSASQARLSSTMMPRAHTAPLQYPLTAAPSTVHSCHTQASPPQQILPQSLRIPWVTHTNDSSYPPTPPTGSHPAAPLQMQCPHPDLRLQDYGTAQQCFLSHPVCSTLWQSRGNLARHLWDVQHWNSRAKSTLVTHSLSRIMEYRYESGGYTGLAHSGADEEETMGWSLSEAKSGKKTAENQCQMLYLVMASGEHQLWLPESP